MIVYFVPTQCAVRQPEKVRIGYSLGDYMLSGSPARSGHCIEYQKFDTASFLSQQSSISCFPEERFLQIKTTLEY